MKEKNDSSNEISKSGLLYKRVVIAAYEIQAGQNLAGYPEDSHDIAGLSAVVTTL